MMAMAFVEFENVSKIYKTGEVEISALHGASRSPPITNPGKKLWITCQ